MNDYLTARDAMSTGVLWVGSTTDIREAYEVMIEMAVRHLPVIDDGRLVGLLSDREVLLASRWRDREIDVASGAVAGIMTTFPLTCRPESRLSDVAELMIYQKLDAVLVVDERDHVVGIVTSTDLVGWFVDEECRASSHPDRSWHRDVLVTGRLTGTAPRPANRRTGSTNGQRMSVH